MPVTEQLYLTTRPAWRAWLRKNGRTSPGVWFIFCKKGSGKPSLPYEDAIGEALCFGWIDSTVRKLDPDRYCLQFTPRKDPTNWSEPNRRRLRELLAAKRVTKAGLAAVAPAVLAVLSAPAVDSRRGGVAPPAELPIDLAVALAADPVARANFERFPPSARQQFAQWVASARRDDTRRRRVTETVRLVGQKLRLWDGGRMRRTDAAATQAGAVGDAGGAKKSPTRSRKPGSRSPASISSPSRSTRPGASAV